MSPHRSILPKSDSPPDTHYYWVQPSRPSLPLLKFVWQYGCSYHGHKRSKLLKNSELQACQVGTSMCQWPLIPTTWSNYPIHRYLNVVRPPRTAVKSRCQPLRPQTLRMSTVNKPPPIPLSASINWATKSISLLILASYMPIMRVWDIKLWSWCQWLLTLWPFVGGLGVGMEMIKGFYYRWSHQHQHGYGSASSMTNNL